MFNHVHMTFRNSDYVCIVNFSSAECLQIQLDNFLDFR